MDSSQVASTLAGVGLPAVEQGIVVGNDKIPFDPGVGVAVARIIQRISQRLFDLCEVSDRHMVELDHRPVEVIDVVRSRLQISHGRKPTNWVFNNER
jgi:hypothetical protein